MLKSILLIIIIIVAAVKLSAASIPFSSYGEENPYDEQMATYNTLEEGPSSSAYSNQQDEFFSTNTYSDESLLRGAPVLPPDPGESVEVPVGDSIPLILLMLFYFLFKTKKEYDIKQRKLSNS